MLRNDVVMDATHTPWHMYGTNHTTHTLEAKYNNNKKNKISLKKNKKKKQLLLGKKRSCF